MNITRCSKSGNVFYILTRGENAVQNISSNREFFITNNHKQCLMMFVTPTHDCCRQQSSIKLWRHDQIVKTSMAAIMNGCWQYQILVALTLVVLEISKLGQTMGKESFTNQVLFLFRGSNLRNKGQEAKRKLTMGGMRSSSSDNKLMQDALRAIPTKGNN